MRFAAISLENEIRRIPGAFASTEIEKSEVDILPCNP